METFVRLRDFTGQDMEAFRKWLYLPHVAKWYHEPQDWLEEVMKRDTDFYWIHHYIVEYQGKPIGFCQYYEYKNSGETWQGNTEVEGTYSIDYLIGEQDYVGKGIGKQIVQSLVEKICQHTNAERIIVQPEQENRASCGTLRSCGFSYNEEFQFYVLQINHNRGNK